MDTTPALTPALDIKDKPIWHIARLIRKNWAKPKYSAVPYINAMLQIESVDGMFGADTSRDVVTRFLINASGWRGEAAREIKAELKRRIKR